jgi:hypothetical protein
MQAVAGSAGVMVEFRGGHDYGVDGALHPVEKYGNRLFESGLGIDFQAKATVNWTKNATHVVYDLEAQAHNDLVTRSVTPRSTPLILVLLLLPKDSKDWVKCSPVDVLLQHSCYWERISGNATLNKYTQRIHIDLKQTFTPDSLKQLLADRQTGKL